MVPTKLNNLLLKKSFFLAASLAIFPLTSSTAFAAPSLIDLPVMQSLLSVLRAQPIYRGENAAAESIGVDLKGWDYVYNRLVQHGIEPQYLAKIFADSRMPERETLFFSLTPREPHDSYRRRQNKREIQNAIRFYRQHYDEFKIAAEQYNVPASVVLAILQVETRCGGYTGNKRVFTQLIRLASAADPENIQENYRKKSDEDSSIQLADVHSRAKWLEATFLPHAVATLVLASQEGVDPLEIKGSGAGAIGLGQFLPGNSYRFGVDGDNNGKVDLFTPQDAIPSVANYLRGHGWSSWHIPLSKQRKIIADYNRSTPYIDLVLYLKDKLELEMAQVRQTRKTRITQASL